MSIKPIRRLLIANRGEIARRVIRSAHEMGISTAAIYADGDVGAPFVRDADTAIALNGTTSAETYLNADKVLAACQRVGADAVHPGYGFLSENAEFAQAVIDAGMRWVGPSPDAIRQMGDKLAAKRLIREADVPTLPALELNGAEAATGHAALPHIDGRPRVAIYLLRPPYLDPKSGSIIEAVYRALEEAGGTASGDVIIARVAALNDGAGFIRPNGKRMTDTDVAGTLRWLVTKRRLHVHIGQDFQAAAKEIGYPVLVKASAGGGGRGMRVVESPDELDAAINGARREAGAAFGDDTLFLERWVTAARHVEIQILGDTHGNVVHLFERECSIQRRHQKIIEEAPSSAVGPELRARMGAAAVSAAQRIGYASAGTVEFLLDGEDFWFLEVNTRLQVEHPVTEEITGLDLVREQLRIAEGEELGYGQDDLAINGHAIEARLYAEDPTRNFLPSPGIIKVWHPAPGGLARFDSGVESGSEVSVEFDPMIAKVIAHAPTRREAAAKLARALEQTALQGLRHNRDFLVATLREPAFLAGDTTTDFIERIDPPRRRELDAQSLADVVIAATMTAQAAHRANAKVLAAFRSGWRNSMMPPERTKFRHGDEEIAVSYRSQRDGTFKVTLGENEPRTVTVFSAEDGQVDLEIDGHRLQLAITNTEDRWLIHGTDFDVELTELPRLPLPGLLEVKGGLTAPMPGNVLTTHVRQGEEVREGQLLLILEAMKMQHRITAPFDGSVKELHVSEGEQVDNGALLVMLEEAGGES